MKRWPRRAPPPEPDGARHEEAPAGPPRPGARLAGRCPSRLQQAGVTLLAGTDAAYANPFLFHGFTLHDELARYVAAGLTPRQALLTATVNPGRFLRWPDLLGRVAEGQKADLVLLDANPLADIAATRRIQAVVADGRLFDRAALDALQREVEEGAAR